MRHLSYLRMLVAAFLMLAYDSSAQIKSRDTYNSLQMGLSNYGRNKEKPYVTAGDRTYIIGTMNGDFPDLGEHVRGEMGGIWMHPIKLLDGYHLSVKEQRSKRAHLLSDALEFVNYPYGNIFKYDSGISGVSISRMQFCPDGQQGVVIEYEIANSSSENKNLDVEFLAKTDLSPVWFSKELGIHDYNDQTIWSKEGNYFSAKDSINNWHVVWGSAISSTRQTVGSDDAKIKSLGQGITCSSTYKISIPAHTTKKIIFVVAGSNKSSKEAIESYQYILQHHDELLVEKKKLYDLIDNRAKINIPDTSLLKVYNWVKVNTQWLIRDVPGIGRGLGAGLMEYPWWFSCDNTYALQAVMQTGDFKLAEQTLRLLKNKSVEKNGNGRIPHEISTNGGVSNPGNTQETAHFIMCVEKLYKWTGNKQFLKEMYPIIKKGIHWLLTDQDVNGNLFPEGYGIMEISGLNAELVDVAVYTQQALLAASKVARTLDDVKASKKYGDLANTLKDKINTQFWNDKTSSYSDFYGTKQQALDGINGTIKQLSQNAAQSDNERIIHYQNLFKSVSLMQDNSQGWTINKNWVINTPLETGIAPYPQAIRALDAIYENNLGKYGPYLSAVEAKHMMTIATGVQAVSEYMYGRTDKSLYYTGLIVKTFNEVLPGSISEMMPNYGCFTQAWTNYGIVLPIISHVFGINPDASKKTIEITPHIPDKWSKDSISISALKVGDNEISMSYRFSKGEKKYTIVSKKTGWNLRINLKPEIGSQYIVNGILVNKQKIGTILLTKTNNHIVILPKKS